MYCFCTPVSSAISLLSVQTESTENITRVSIFAFPPSRQSPFKVYNRTPSMQTARIAELLQPFLTPGGEHHLTEDLLLSISMYIDILIRWNARLNLTAIRDPEEIV